MFAIPLFLLSLVEYLLQIVETLVDRALLFKEFLGCRVGCRPTVCLKMLLSDSRRRQNRQSIGADGAVLTKVIGTLFVGLENFSAQLICGFASFAHEMFLRARVLPTGSFKVKSQLRIVLSFLAARFLVDKCQLIFGWTSNELEVLVILPLHLSVLFRFVHQVVRGPHVNVKDSLAAFLVPRLGARSPHILR